MRLNRSGIYKITNTVNGHCYIGSAVKLTARWSLHRIHARSGNHHSPHLQAAWNKYGEEAFTFTALILCDRANLLMYEQMFIDNLHPEYNVAQVAGSWEGRTHSAEAKAKVSAARKGKPLSAEHRAKLSAAKIGTHPNRDYSNMSQETREKIGRTTKERWERGGFPTPGRTGKKDSPEVLAKRGKAVQRALLAMSPEERRARMEPALAAKRAQKEAGL